jgi:pilus assembly protein Flp/PilA
MTNGLNSFLRNSSAATSIEYGMIAALISIAALAALTSISISLQDMYNLIVGAFS